MAIFGYAQVVHEAPAQLTRATASTHTRTVQGEVKFGTLRAESWADVDSRRLVSPAAPPVMRYRSGGARRRRHMPALRRSVCHFRQAALRRSQAHVGGRGHGAGGEVRSGLNGALRGSLAV